MGSSEYESKCTDFSAFLVWASPASHDVSGANFSGTRERSQHASANRLLAGASACGACHHRGVFAQSGGEGDEMVLFVLENFADVSGHGLFAEAFALADAFAIMANGGHLVFEIELEHLFGFL